MFNKKCFKLNANGTIKFLKLDSFLYDPLKDNTNFLNNYKFLSYKIFKDQ